MYSALLMCASRLGGVLPLSWLLCWRMRTYRCSLKHRLQTQSFHMRAHTHTHTHIHTHVNINTHTKTQVTIMLMNTTRMLLDMFRLTIIELNLDFYLIPLSSPWFPKCLPRYWLPSSDDSFHLAFHARFPYFNLCGYTIYPNTLLLIYLHRSN